MTLQVGFGSCPGPLGLLSGLESPRHCPPSWGPLIWAVAISSVPSPTPELSSILGPPLLLVRCWAVAMSSVPSPTPELWFTLGPLPLSWCCAVTIFSVPQSHSRALVQSRASPPPCPVLVVTVSSVPSPTPELWSTLGLLPLSWCWAVAVFFQHLLPAGPCRCPHLGSPVATSPVGRNPDINMEALEEFKKFMQHKGLSEEDIFMPLQMGERTAVPSPPCFPRVSL